MRWKPKITVMAVPTQMRYKIISQVGAIQEHWCQLKLQMAYCKANLPALE
jgi:hypothetical protein